MASIKKHIFSIGIAVIVVILFMYGVRTFYPDPSINCWSSKPINDGTSCMQEGGMWMSDGDRAKPAVPYSGGYCDFNEKCNTLREPYSRNVAIIAFILGMGILYYGIVGKKIAEQTTTGFVGGGLLIIIVGVVEYWSFLTDTTRFFALLIVFGLLVWLGNKYKNYFK